MLYPGLDLTKIEHVERRREPYVLVVPSEHPLAGRAAVTLNEAAVLPLIATRPGTGLRRCLDRVFAGRDDQPRIVIETNELASTMAFVSVGLGAALLTATIARQVDVPVAVVPLSDADPFVLAGAWRDGSHSAVVQRAIDLIVARTRGETPKGRPLLR